ncbi:MAG: ATP synthase F1 subunit gamma [Clostridia bacterium]|nr:ATP synthase F1 subunit gamma [Clostridia bacterium]
MAGMKEIKARIKSVESTMQITKAMELVATSKLRRAKENVERTRPFYQTLGTAINDIISASADIESEWFLPRSVKKTLFIVFAGDRGLAGGYNSNVFRVAEELSRDAVGIWLPIGKKSLEYAKHKKHEILTDSFECAGEMGVGDMLALGDIVSDGYRCGEYDRVIMIFTEFVSMMTQRVVYEELFPLNQCASGKSSEMESDCDGVEMLDKIIPNYVGGILYSALCESLASESGARRTAMNSANKNAEEMIGTLMLKYNRARQAVITQEITEIVSGAEAL